MKITTRTLLTVLALIAFLTQPVTAAEFGGVRELTVYPLVQYFTWEEFSGGERLLKESGPQYGAGGSIKLHLLEGAAGAMTLSDRLELFGSEVDYEGQLQDGTPYNTTVGYVGFQDRLDLGWAIPIHGATVEPFSGLGYRWWLRDLQGSGGYTEKWYSLYALFGMRSLYTLSNDVRFMVMGAAKYPFENRNMVDYPGSGNVDLVPGNVWSALAEASVTYRHLFAGVYYENFIFEQSPVVAKFSTIDNRTIFLRQPRSESEIYGLRVGWAFK